MVDVATARWVAARHSCAAAIILQAWAVVGDMDVDGVVRTEQSHGLHEFRFIISRIVAVIAQSQHNSHTIQ